jgi:AcrR family transcriptional regulator
MGNAPTKLRAKQKEFTRERFLNAARQIFMARGYVDVTVDDIADGAGSSRATFYAYFRSKTKVALALLDQVEVKAIASYGELDQIMTGPADLREARVREWFRRGLKSYRKWQKYSLAMWQAATIEPEVGERVLASSHKFMAAMTETFKNMNAKDRKRAQERAMMLELMFARLMYLAAHHDMPISEDAMLDFMTELWLSQLAPPAKR